MRSSTITRKLASVVAATLLAAGLLALNASPAAAACNYTEVYVTVLGDRHNSPTNGCLGPSNWGLLTCYSNRAYAGNTLVVGVGACIALPA